MNRKNLKVPYKDKELVKELGAKWDPLERTWYIDRKHMSSHDLTNHEKATFGRWLVSTSESKIVEFTPTKWCPAFK